MKINYLESREILDFEKEIGQELVCHERPRNLHLPRFYVGFLYGEVMTGGCLMGASGNGCTIDAALQDYCKEISNTRMAFGAYTSNRKEVEVPKLIHTLLLNK